MKSALLLPPLAALALALPAAAQQHDHGHVATPASATTATQTGTTLEGYRPWSPDTPLQDWRAANDEAGRLGGHAGQLVPPADGTADTHGSHDHTHQHGAQQHSSGHAHHHEARP